MTVACVLDETQSFCNIPVSYTHLDGSSNIQRTSVEKLEFPFGLNAEISSDLIFNRPDVVQAEYVIKKAAFDVKAAKKAFLPSINLNEMVGFESLKAGRLFNWNSTVYQLSLIHI